MSRYRCDASSVARARAHCRKTLVTDLDIGEDSAIVETAELVVSELVSNAVQAEATTLKLTLRLDSSQIVIEVEDDAPGLPIARDVPVTSTHGRGLAIVAAVSASCGIEVSGQHKVVWARLSLLGSE